MISIDLQVNPHKVNVHKQYWALEKVSGALDTYNVVCTSYSLKYLTKKGYKYIYDAIEREILEVKD